VAGDAHVSPARTAPQRRIRSTRRPPPDRGKIAVPADSQKPREETETEAVTSIQLSGVVGLAAIGTAFTRLSAVGILTMPDPYTRLHPSGKLKGFGGKVLRTSLSKEDEARPQAALDATKTGGA